jgi:hypothetical protein
MLRCPELDFTTPEPTREQLRDMGMAKAVKHADEVVEKWSDKAFTWLCRYLMMFEPGYEFMSEDFTAWAYANGLEQPPSLRAIGSIMIKAAKLNLIEKVRIEQVKNKTAHCAFASVWRIK